MKLARALNFAVAAATLAGGAANAQPAGPTRAQDAGKRDEIKGPPKQAAGKQTRHKTEQPKRDEPQARKSKRPCVGLCDGS